MQCLHEINLYFHKYSSIFFLNVKDTCTFNLLILGGFKLHNLCKETDRKHLENAIIGKFAIKGTHPPKSELSFVLIITYM